jgi:hypothetical protein
MPPQDAGKRLLLGQGHGNAAGGGMLPLLPGGGDGIKERDEGESICNNVAGASDTGDDANTAGMGFGW